MRELQTNDTGAAGIAGSTAEAAAGKQTLTEGARPVQRKAGGAADSEVAGGGGGGGAGAPLPPPVQDKMDDAFGFSFSGVRVHEGNEAPNMGAQAYTQGNDVHFAPGAYDPGSSSGQELIGHELSHVVQQSEGRVGANKQFKGAGLNDDPGLESEADVWGAAAARGEQVRSGGGVAASGDGPIQRKEQPAGAVAAAHTFAVPAVVDVAAIADPVRRNHAINQSYHTIDVAMTGYMGDPLVANWFTFGQHASREAGTQIRNLQHGIQVLNSAIPILQGLNSYNPVTVFNAARQAMRSVQQIWDLLHQEGLMQMAMQLALARAGITESDIQDVINDAASALAVAPTAGLMGLGGAILFVPFIGKLMGLAAKLIVAIPAIIQSVELVSANMQQGNREIYQNVAPAAHSFLSAAQGAANGVPAGVAFAGDTSGFLTAAFAEYAEVRRLGDEARAAPGTADSATKLATRQAKAAHANLTIGFQEQLVILQPIFDTMRTELGAMSGTMVLHDPNGAHPLANNWGDFYTRMGIDPATAPSDPRTITAGSLPPMLPASDPRMRGTIGEYFGGNITNEKIHEAPPSIAPI